MNNTTMISFVRPLAIVAFTLAATAALAQVVPAKPTNTAKGQVLADAKGMSLYVFDKDEGGKSACNGPCAVNWPPLMAAANAKASGDWTIVTRDDGGKQWAYKSKPLYAWKNDKAPGDITGDGFNGVWHLAKP
jgi:predicted lipoprotein with Yx(FWY)xxD motif